MTDPEKNKTKVAGIPDPKKDPASTYSRLERIKYVVRRICITQSNLAERLGVDTAFVSRQLNGKLRLSQNFVSKISRELGVSMDWLMYGIGSPMESASGKQTVQEGTPVYDIDVTAGNYNLDLAFTQDRIIGFVNLPNISKDALIVHVSGDSMEPEIKNGTYIAIRPVEDFQSVLYGQIYVIVTEDFRRVKYLRRDPKSKDCVILQSANPKYDDIHLHKDRIIRMFRVDAILDYKICG